VEVKRLLFVVILAIILIGLPLLVLSDTDTSIADADIPDKEVTGSISKTDNSSASGTTTITMYAVAAEKLSEANLEGLTFVEETGDEPPRSW